MIYVQVFYGHQNVYFLKAIILCTKR